MTDNNNYLETIDSNEKAYCLGFFSYINENHSKYSKYCYELNNIDIAVDNKLLRYFENVVDILYDDETSSISMNIYEVSTLNYIKTNITNFDNISDKYKKEFIRGLYEYNYLISENETNDIFIKKSSLLEDTKVLEKMAEYLNIPYINCDLYYQVKYGCSSVDILGLIYNNINNNCSINYCNYNKTIPRCCVIKTDENAIIPSKKNWSDVGFDLSIIKKLEDFNTKTSLYDTGIKIQLDFGYYAEIVPRSSMSKSGYILANSIGIIDNSYRGNLMIALTKIADDAIEIQYPYRCCQLIIKKQIDVNLEEVANIDTTKRNNGGFGSTD